MKALLNKKDVERLTSLSNTTIWRLTKKGEFPQGIQISTRRLAWLESDIQEWIEQKVR